MKYKIAALLILFCITANAALTEADIKSFEKGISTYDQVVAKLGQPVKVEFNDEGLKSALYFDQKANLNGASTLAIIASVGSLFIPGAAGMAASVGSMTVETVAGGAEAQSSYVSFTFDKNGKLVYYRGAINSLTSNTFESNMATTTISSEDNAAPLPNIAIELTEEQRVPPSLSVPAGSRPKLGINYVPISALDEKTRNDFAQAKFDGLIVTVVAPGSVAHGAGLQQWDYLYIVNGMLVNSIESLSKALSTVKIGDTIKAHVRRVDRNANIHSDQLLVLKF